MLVKLSKWLLVVALAFSIGAHWAILQSVAWCGMAVGYSEGTSFTEGLAKTFDGKHPCKLCKAVAEGRQSEKKQESKLEVKKLDLYSPAVLQMVISPALQPDFVSIDSVFLHRTTDPLTPPPKVA